MDEIAEILDIEIVEKPVENVPVIVPESNIENDLKYARSTYYEIISQGKDALEGALRVANLSEHPRAYEVVGSLLKNLADVNKQLIELAALNKKEETPSVQSITNNVQFIGTSADLNKLIADKLENI